MWCVVLWSALLSSQLEAIVQALHGWTSTQALSVIEEKRLPLHKRKKSKSQFRCNKSWLDSVTECYALLMYYSAYVESTHGYAIYEYLREDAKTSQEKHFKALITRLRKVRQHHMEELKLLAKYYKQSGRVLPPASPNFASTASSTVSLARIRKMTSTVRPSLNSRHNIALQVLDVEEEHASQSFKDSQV